MDTQFDSDYQALSSDRSLSRIDLEMAILAHIMLKYEEKDPDKLLKIESCINRLNSCQFSLVIHLDIFKFIYNQYDKTGSIPSPWHICNHLCSLQKYKNTPEQTRKMFADIVDFNDFFLFLHKLDYLVCLLEEETNKNRIKTELSKVLESGNIDKLKEIVDVDFDSNDGNRLQKKIEQYQIAPTTFDKAIIKRDMRQSLGLMPQEIQEVFDTLLSANREIPQIQKGEDFLLEDFGDAGWIYPGLIPANCATMIPGAPGTGKTMFCYDLLFSYLLNQPFLGEDPSVLAKNPNNRGLIINSDQPPKDAQTMLRKNVKALKSKGKWDIINRWTMQDLTLLETALKDSIYSFVVVDSYTGIHKHDPKYDENKTNAAQAMDEFQRLASKYSCTFVVVQHGLKSEARGINKARGNQMIAGTASCVINLDQAQPDKNGNCDPLIKFLEIAKIRNAPLGKRVIKFNPLTYSYELTMDNVNQSIINANRLANTLLNTCFVRNPTHLFSESELIKNVEGLGRREMLINALTKLEQRGLIHLESDDNMDMRYQYKVPNQAAIEVLKDIGF